jgi:regulatory protein
MKITKITTQKKNADRVSIFVDGVYSFSLSLNDLLKTKLKTNQDLSDSDLKKLKKISDDSKLKMRALEWLLIRPRSKKELIEYLRRKKIDPEAIDIWVNDFEKKRYVDDTRFATWWTEQRRTGKKKSARFIAQELNQKGVNREIIQEVIQKNETTDSDTLRALIEKKKKLPRYAVDEQKLITYLQRQGYSFSLIKEVLAE